MFDLKFCILTFIYCKTSRRWELIVNYLFSLFIFKLQRSKTNCNEYDLGKRNTEIDPSRIMWSLKVKFWKLAQCEDENTLSDFPRKISTCLGTPCHLDSVMFISGFHLKILFLAIFMETNTKLPNWELEFYKRKQENFLLDEIKWHLYN